MNRREFVTAAGASAVLGGALLPREARASVTLDPTGDDDTTNLEDALAQAVLDDVPVVLGAGIFRITRPIEIPSGVAVMGQGPSSTAIKWHASATSASTDPLLSLEEGAVAIYIGALALAASSSALDDGGIGIGDAVIELENIAFVNTDSWTVAYRIVDAVQISFE